MACPLHSIFGGIAMEDKQKILKEIAHLESLNDMLFTEIKYLDKLLRLSGFPNGLESLKSTAEDMLEDEEEIEEE